MGQSGYSLTCGVNGVENLKSSITYQWIENNGVLVGTNEVLSFSSLRLSDAGRYICQATVSSPYLNNDITMTNTQDVRLQSKHLVAIYIYIYIYIYIIIIYNWGNSVHVRQFINITDSRLISCVVYV